MRNIFCQEIIKAFEKKPFVFLSGDLGFKALEPLQEKLADHFINAGISEQNMVSTAAGIAKTGLEVFVYSIAPFIYARPFEQIRNDICLHNLPVTLVGNGGGYGYGVMGATHHAIEDYGSLLCLQNMQAFVPVFACDVACAITRIREIKKPSYLRLGLAEKLDGIDEVAYGAWRKMLKGKLGTLIMTGAISGKLLKEFQKESENNRPNIWILSEIPLSEKLPDELLCDIAETQKLCVLEEHVAQGGVGQILAAKLLTSAVAVKTFVHLHAQGYVSGFYGSQNFHCAESGLSKDAVINALK